MDKYKCEKIKKFIQVLNKYKQNMLIQILNKYKKIQMRIFTNIIFI